MDVLSNQFKQRLADGDTVIGLWSGLVSSLAAEMCAQSAFDFLLFDAEHAPYSDGDVLACIQAISAYDTYPIVRTVSDDPMVLKRYCDIGVQTFVVPMVETAAQATGIVEGVRYPPDGTRGLGTSLARAARWNQVPDYVARANKEMCVICQVETRQGLENLEDIAGVEGVDMIFIGPADLGASLGYPEQNEMISIVEKAITDIRSFGNRAGVFVVDPTLAARYVDCGAQMIGAGTDCGILVNGAKRLAHSFKHGGSEKGDY
ncbi:MAG: HpcH/HpaI aldolase/citrate lyase family protein [Pseudomonadota bacterium]